MATKTQQPTQQKTAKQQGEVQYGSIQINGMSGDDYVTLLETKIKTSQAHFNTEYKLDNHTKENLKLYRGEQISDADDETDDNLALDNRIFSSMRTNIPYTTSRVSEPEVYPSSNSIEAKKFAEDFEKALHIKADMEKTKMKLRFALEDAVITRRGYLKPRYDKSTGNFFKLEYVPSDSIIIDHVAKPYEEPRYFRFKMKRSIEDLFTMFPDMRNNIIDLFGVKNPDNAAELQTEYDINEDWNFIQTEAGELDLLCCWNYKGKALGCIQDPNWIYGDGEDNDNFLEQHMMPLIPINILSDGRSFIDHTSYVEQAKYSQRTIDTRSQQIGENAGLGNIGMPVVDSKALAEDQDENVTFEPDTVLVLDVTNANGNSINDVFTTWKAGNLSADVYKDKEDAIEAVQNAFGASNVLQGNESDNRTLGQDELLRDQSMGRLSEWTDVIDAAVERLYKLMAQFMLVYGNPDEIFKFVGEDGAFDYIIMHSDELDTNAEIRVKAGTSMPIDNPQRRATADKAASMAMIDPLTFWEIMDQPNAQKYAKRVADWTNNPQGFMADIEEEIFNRDAYVDLELIKKGQNPPYRDDLPKEYFDYLNHVVLSDDLENPNIPMPARQAMAQFIAVQIDRAQKMLAMAETQLPTAADVQNFNQQADQANQNAPQEPGQPAQQTPPQNQKIAANPGDTQPVT